MKKVNVNLGVLILAATLVVAGCKKSDDAASSDNDAATDESAHMCGDQANCMNTVDLADGLKGESGAGVFMAKIMSQNGLNVDGNEWMVMVSDASGTAVEGATVSVQTFSVDCGHEGPCPSATAVEHMPGMYMIMPTHAHGGPWDTIVTVDKGGQTDEITWHFCVDAPSHGETLPTVTCPDGSQGDTSHDHHGEDAGA